MKRELRQGNPLPPFLSLIVAEVIQVIIFDCYKKKFRGIKLAMIGDDDTNISLLKYADDSLFLGESSKSKVKKLIIILKWIQNTSGIGKVNYT